MFGYGLAGDGEVLRNGVGGHGMDGDQDEDGSPGGICNGLKNVASHDWENNMKPISCKYMCNRLASQNLFLHSLEEWPGYRTFNPVIYRKFCWRKTLIVSWSPVQ